MSVIFARHRFRRERVADGPSLVIARRALRVLKLQTTGIEFLPLRGLDAPVRDEMTAILDTASWRWNWLAKRNECKTRGK